MKTIDIQAEHTEKALLVQAVLGRRTRRDAEGSLAELARLADTAGAIVVGTITQRLARPTPNFYVGGGKLDEIKLACEHTGANLVIFDNELSPGQVNNLDMELGVKVIDRTELILQIFARRAKSAEAQLQVELAQLQYLVTRIPASEKQHRFTGGIGMRGPGESPFQLRNEPMRKRIAEIKKKLSVILQRRQQTRSHRALPLVALVGYTNAGKSTLLNAMAASHTYVDDRLFATLDTKTSPVRLSDGRDILMTDTVGFIRDLPHGLVASFRSTLDEAAAADLLLVVADASHPGVNEQIDVALKTLDEIGAVDVPMVLVANKSDAPGAKSMADLCADAILPRRVAISALKRQGLPELKAIIADALPPPVRPPPSHGWREW